MRKMDFGGDYEGALAAAQQAAATAQLIGAITERLEAARQFAACQPNGEAAAEGQARTAFAEIAPLYSIAFKDHTIESATRYWTDGAMLHYMTPQGGHVQVRLALVDRALSVKLNQAQNLDFRLPD
jgi:hypothetical protein